MSVKILLATNSGRENYINAIEHCGGSATATYLNDVGTDFDGLILCGGNDIDPQYYGEELNGAVKVDKERDEAELLLARQFIDAGKPVMGICRGYQLLNVYFGGTLHQHIENVTEHRSCGTEGEGDLVHLVKAAKGSIVNRLYGDEFSVNSYHHQAIKKMGKHLKITMTSMDRTVIEGMEHETLPVFGVQWHPERMCFENSRKDTVNGALLFEYFIQLCEKQKDNSN